MNENFTDEIALNSYFKIWNRGDGIGEVYLFNSIVGYIHGETEISPEDYYHYDEELQSYVADEVEFSPVSCFPGVLSCEKDILTAFHNQSIESIDSLTSMLNSLPSSLLPTAPKGSVFDIFSQQDKFLVCRDFNFDIIKNGTDLNPSIVNNFNDFSFYLKSYFLNYPEVSIKFSQHSYLNGNVYFIYSLNDKYFLHLIFNSENQIVSCPINKTYQMKDVIVLDCNESSYESISKRILEKLKISNEFAVIPLELTSLSLQKIPRGKNKFLNELISNQLEYFFTILSNSNSFILKRNLKSNVFSHETISIERNYLKFLVNKFSIFDLKPSEFLSLLINHYFSL